LPQPPAAHSFPVLIGLAASIPSDNDSDQVPLDKAIAASFDPAFFSRFGSLPASHVLVHLMRYTATLVEHCQFTQNGNNNEALPLTTVPGGMGSSLFKPTQRGPHASGKSASKSGTSRDSGDEVALQLLVAFFLLLHNKRSDAIECLQMAVAREQQAVQGDDNEADDDADDGTPLSEEGDNPALTLAMNYVEDDIPLLSDSLENKGMRRKAAAAAHDAAAAFLKFLRRRTDAWKSRVKLYSHCLVDATKRLCQFLQFMVCWSLHEQATRNGNLVLNTRTEINRISLKTENKYWALDVM
jgi:hypothetical protein